MRHPVLTACATGVAALVATAVLVTPASAAEPESLTAAVYGGVLMIHGTEGADGVLVQRSEDAGLPAGKVLLEGSAAKPGPGCTSIPDARETLCSGVKRLIVDLGGGNDELNINTQVDLPAIVNAGAGDDKVYTSDADDVINGGDGNDTLAGYGGRDVINGGGGDDSCSGEVVNNCEHVLQ